METSPRRLLRIASIGLAGGATFALFWGAFFMVKAVEARDYPFSAGLLAGWAVVVWMVGGLVAAFAIWSWRATFRRAAIGLTIAGTVGADWTVNAFGHDQAAFIALAMATVTVLVPTAAAVALARWQRRSR